MPVIVLIMLSVLMLDSFVAALFLSWLFWFGTAAVAAPMGYLYHRWFIKRPVAAARGWNFGKAIEITNPDHPEQIESAMIDAQVIKLGMLSLGAPGAGKTESVMLGYLHGLPSYVPGAGWAFFEGKGDIDIYKKTVAMGQKPDHFFSSELPGSETINLFEGCAQDVIDRLQYSLIGTTASTSYYSDAQRAVLLKVVPLLKSLPKPTNLRDLYTVLAVEDAGAALLHDAKEAGAKATDIQLARTWLEEKFAKRVQEIKGLLNRLYVFCNGPNAMRLNAYQPEIDITKIVSEGKKLYLHLPLSQFSKDVAIAIIEMLYVESKRRQLAGTENMQLYPLLFDDWGAFFHSNFGPFSARCRSAAMPLSFGFQSRAQLTAVSEAFADELDDTIATKIILNIHGNKTAAFAVEMLGTYDKKRLSASEHNNGQSRGTNITDQRTTRIEARDVRELLPGEAFISTREPQADGNMKNALWKLRLPLPDFKDWQQITMPPAREHNEGEGLGYWDKFVDEARISEFVASIENQKQKESAVIDTARKAAAGSLHLNPGFGDDD